MQKIVLLLSIILSVTLAFGQQNDTFSRSITSQLSNIGITTSIIKNKLDSCCNNKGRVPKHPCKSKKISINISDSYSYYVKFVDSSCRVIINKLDSCCCYKNKPIVIRPDPIIAPEIHKKKCNYLLCAWGPLLVVLILLLAIIAIFIFSKKRLGDSFSTKLLEAIERNLSQIPFIFASWMLGLILFVKTYCSIDFCSLEQIHYYQLLLLLFSVSLILLPFLKSIKIGKILELERNIKETKEEVKDFKTEIRHSFQILTSTVNNSINNLNNQTQITYNYGVNSPLSDEQLLKVKEEYEGKIKQLINYYEVDSTNLDKSSYLNVPIRNRELFSVRYNIEVELRRIWTRRFGANESAYEFRHKPIIKIIQELSNFGIIERNFYDIVREVLSICNYAVHGEDVTSDQYNFAIDFAPEIIYYLKTIQ